MDKLKEIDYKKVLKESYPYLIIIVVILLVRAFLFTPIIVNGTSMYPTLKEHDMMILNKISLRVNGLERFDIVVVDNEDYIIKRVIGLPGETVAYYDGKLYINGKHMEDNYATSTTKDFDPVKLGKNEYFVMGDNREVSKDSRTIGPVNIKNIKGKASLRLVPLNKIGIVE